MKYAKFIIPVFILIIVGFAVWNVLHPQEALPESDRLAVHYIDVGQGDCIYITCGGENMLIDCGESGNAENVINYLESHGAEKLDYLVGTHPHSDHMGGMSKIVEHFDIGEVIIPHLDDSDIPTTRFYEKFLDACEAKNFKIKEAKFGRNISLGAAEIEIIAPISDDYGNLNNYSIGMIMHHGSKSFIFTGDAETLAEQEMINSGKLEDIDVYKAGHHGSDTSSSEAFLEIIKPDYAVISCGAGNSYGHPANVTLEKLDKYTKNVYRTDLVGTVVVESDGNEITVSTER